MIAVSVPLTVDRRTRYAVTASTVVGSRAPGELRDDIGTGGVERCRHPRHRQRRGDGCRLHHVAERAVASAVASEHGIRVRGAVDRDGVGEVLLVARPTKAMVPPLALRKTR